jgi:hypothetical protein
MDRKKYRITGSCFYLDEDKSLVALPLGTIVEVSELPGAMLMRWTDSASELRHNYYTPEIWLRHVSKHIEPMEEI